MGESFPVLPRAVKQDWRFAEMVPEDLPANRLFVVQAVLREHQQQAVVDLDGPVDSM